MAILSTNFWMSPSSLLLVFSNLFSLFSVVDGGLTRQQSGLGQFGYGQPNGWTNHGGGYGGGESRAGHGYGGGGKWGSSKWSKNANGRRRNGKQGRLPPTLENGGQHHGLDMEQMEYANEPEILPGMHPTEPITISLSQSEAANQFWNFIPLLNKLWFLFDKAGLLFDNSMAYAPQPPAPYPLHPNAYQHPYNKYGRKSRRNNTKRGMMRMNGIPHEYGRGNNYAYGQFDELIRHKRGRHAGRNVCLLLHSSQEIYTMFQRAVYANAGNGVRRRQNAQTQLDNVYRQIEAQQSLEGIFVHTNSAEMKNTEIGIGTCLRELFLLRTMLEIFESLSKAIDGWLYQIVSATDTTVHQIFCPRQQNKRKCTRQWLHEEVEHRRGQCKHIGMVVMGWLTGEEMAREMAMLNNHSGAVVADIRKFGQFVHAHIDDKFSVQIIGAPARGVLGKIKTALAGAYGGKARGYGPGDLRGPPVRYKQLGKVGCKEARQRGIHIPECQ